jgi:hypothetical protein
MPWTKGTSPVLAYIRRRQANSRQRRARARRWRCAIDGIRPGEIGPSWSSLSIGSRRKIVAQVEQRARIGAGAKQDVGALRVSETLEMRFLALNCELITLDLLQYLHPPAEMAMHPANNTTTLDQGGPTVAPAPARHEAAWFSWTGRSAICGPSSAAGASNPEGHGKCGV